MSAADLRKLADTREQLEKLDGRKAALAKDLAQVDKEIAKLLASLTGKKKTRKKAGSKKAAKKRVANSPSKNPEFALRHRSPEMMTGDTPTGGSAAKM